MSLLSQQDFDRDQLKEHIRMTKERILNEHPEYVEKLMTLYLSRHLQNQFNKSMMANIGQWTRRNPEIMNDFLAERLLYKPT